MVAPGTVQALLCSEIFLAAREDCHETVCIPAHVDLPTPPLPEATATICCTSGIPSFFMGGPIFVAYALAKRAEYPYIVILDQYFHVRSLWLRPGHSGRLEMVHVAHHQQRAGKQQRQTTAVYWYT